MEKNLIDQTKSIAWNFWVSVLGKSPASFEQESYAEEWRNRLGKTHVSFAYMDSHNRDRFLEMLKVYYDRPSYEWVLIEAPGNNNPTVVPPTKLVTMEEHPTKKELYEFIQRRFEADNWWVGTPRIHSEDAIYCYQISVYIGDEVWDFELYPLE